VTNLPTADSLRAAKSHVSHVRTICPNSCAHSAHSAFSLAGNNLRWAVRTALRPVLRTNPKRAWLRLEECHLGTQTAPTLPYARATLIVRFKAIRPDLAAMPIVRRGSSGLVARVVIGDVARCDRARLVPCWTIARDRCLALSRQKEDKKG
jgi:hypothetical protein